jgi:hypothetical protein
MPAHAHPVLSCINDDLVVHSEGNHRHTPSSGQPDDARTGDIPGKMIRPPLLTRVKKSDCFTSQRVFHNHRRTLEFVASMAGEAKIFKFGLALFVPRNDMIDDHRITGIELGCLAIGAAAIIRF